MKIAVIIVIVLAIIGGAVTLRSGDKNANQQTAGASTTVDETSSQASGFESIRANMQTGAQLVDVRTPEEFAEAHIEGAINLPLSDIQAGTFPSDVRSTKLYVYCRSGNRSAQATELLASAGYGNVTDLGAMSDLVAQGAPQVR